MARRKSRYSGIGGQAVLEGVMMKNKEKYAVAVRKPDGEIEVEVETYQGLAHGSKFKELPFIRGIFNFLIKYSVLSGNYQLACAHCVEKEFMIYYIIIMLHGDIKNIVLTSPVVLNQCMRRAYRFIGVLLYYVVSPRVEENTVKFKIQFLLG